MQSELLFNPYDIHIVILILIVIQILMQAEVKIQSDTLEEDVSDTIVRIELLSAGISKTSQSNYDT